MSSLPPEETCPPVSQEKKLSISVGVQQDADTVFSTEDTFSSPSSLSRSPQVLLETTSLFMNRGGNCMPQQHHSPLPAYRSPVDHRPKSLHHLRHASRSEPRNGFSSYYPSSHDRYQRQYIQQHQQQYIQQHHPQYIQQQHPQYIQQHQQPVYNVYQPRHSSEHTPYAGYTPDPRIISSTLHPYNPMEYYHDRRRFWNHSPHGRYPYVGGFSSHSAPPAHVGPPQVYHNTYQRGISHPDQRHPNLFREQISQEIPSSHSAEPIDQMNTLSKRKRNRQQTISRLTLVGPLEVKGHMYDRIRVWTDGQSSLYYDCDCAARKPVQNLSKIKRHVRLHRQGKYSCSFCNKEFVHHLQLNAHKKVHKERPASQLGEDDEVVEDEEYVTPEEQNEKKKEPNEVFVNDESPTTVDEDASTKIVIPSPVHALHFFTNRDLLR